MKAKEEETEIQESQGSALLPVIHLLSVLAGLGYTIFLVSNYGRSALVGGILSFGILGLYTWRIYLNTALNKEGKLSTARGIFNAIGGLFLLFIADMFVCANSIYLH